jgi:hypothetical protein
MQHLFLYKNCTFGVTLEFELRTGAGAGAVTALATFLGGVAAV